MRRVRLSAEQIEFGGKLRFEQAKTWYFIAKALGCNSETIRRELDPLFDADRKAVYSRRNARTRERQRVLRERRPKQLSKPKQRNTVANVRGALVPQDEESRAIRATVKDDKAFVAAMRDAIKHCREKAPDGIERSPGTWSPQAMTRTGAGSFSPQSSPAGMCADS